jgi:hypothetical protein
MLHQLLERCKQSYGDEESLHRAVDALRRDGVLALPNDPNPPRTITDRAAIPRVERAALVGPYEFCKGTTEDQKNESDDWLNAAIEQKDYWSLQEMAVKLGTSADGVAAWESLWKQGYFSALPALSLLYQQGVDGGAPDYVRAFAYNYVQFKLVEAAYESGRSNVTLPHVVAVEDTVRRSTGNLTPQQTEDAIRLAEQLLRETFTCCAGIG